MKPIELNLASNPYRNDTPLSVGLGVLLVLALSFTFFNAYGYLTADTTKSRLETRLADHRNTMNAMRLESEQIREELAGVDAEVLGAQASFVSGILAQRNFSWTELLNALEEVLPWNVRLSVIRPDFGSMGRVTLALRGTARDVDAFYDFQDALEASGPFSEVVPGTWQYSARDSMSDDTVEFVMSCRYDQLQPEDGAEVQKAGLPLGGRDDEAREERIVVEGESEPAAAGDDPLLDTAPQVDSSDSNRAASVAPGPATSAPAEAAPGRAPASRPDRGRAGAEEPSGKALTPEERRARRAARRGGTGEGVIAGGAAGSSAAPAGGEAAPGTASPVRGPRAPAGAAGAGSARGSTGRAAANQQPASDDQSGRTAGQIAPKEIPVEELVEVSESGVKNLKLKPAPERPARTTEEGSEAGSESSEQGSSGSGSGSESGSGSGSGGSGGSGSGGSGSGGSGSGGGSSGGTP